MIVNASLRRGLCFDPSLLNCSFSLGELLYFIFVHYCSLFFVLIFTVTLVKKKFLSTSGGRIIVCG